MQGRRLAPDLYSHPPVQDVHSLGEEQGPRHCFELAEVKVKSEPLIFYDEEFGFGLRWLTLADRSSVAFASLSREPCQGFESPNRFRQQ